MKELFTVEELNPRLLRISDVADTHMYLLRGDREAALLDTGVGCGDLRALISTLTDKPVKVLLTHGHVDHAMGAGQFPEVYLSPLDREVYEEHSELDGRLRYAQGGLGPANPETAFVTAKMLQPVKPFDEFLPLRPGDRFDLGGVSVRVFDGCGHTPGSMVFLLPELRMLLTGDACNFFTLVFDRTCPTIAQYRETLLRLKADTDGSYDTVLLSHSNGGMEPPVTMIQNVIEVCDDILAGNTDDVPFTGFHGEPVCLAKAMNMDFEHGSFTRVDGKAGNIVYDPAKVR